MPEDFSDLIPDSKKPKLPAAPVAPIAPAAPAAAAPAAPGGLTDFSDLIPKPAPGAAAPAAPAAPAAAPSPAPAPPTANDLILQHLGGQRGIGSDQVAAPPRQESWWDAVPGTKYYGEPAQPGPQSWFDWMSKTYKPTPAAMATQFGNGFTYGLSPLAAQMVKSGSQAATGNNPLPSALEPDAMRQRIQEAGENLGPLGPVLTGAGMAVNPATYVGGGMLGMGKLGWNAAEKLLPDAAAAATKYLPESVAKWVPESLFPKMGSAAMQTGTVSAANTAGQGGGPSDIAKSFGTGALYGAAVPPVLEQFPGGPVTAGNIVDRTTQAAQAAELAKAGIKIPSKALGFKVEGQTDPSVSDVQGYREWLQSQSADEPSVANNLPTASQRMMTSIDKALASPDVAPVVAQAQKAQAQAEWAKTLERWGSNEGLAGRGRRRPGAGRRGGSGVSPRHAGKHRPAEHRPGAGSHEEGRLAQCAPRLDWRGSCSGRHS